MNFNDIKSAIETKQASLVEFRKNNVNASNQGQQTLASKKIAKDVFLNCVLVVTLSPNSDSISECWVSFEWSDSPKKVTPNNTGLLDTIELVEPEEFVDYTPHTDWECENADSIRALKRKLKNEIKVGLGIK